MRPCPCGSGAGLDACCGPIVDGAAARTAEALMRSRYTAYVLGNFCHLERTHAPETRGTFDRAAAEAAAGSIEWTGLEVRATSGGGETDDLGTVEFAARFAQAGRPGVLHELSSFRRDLGRWVYVDGLANPGRGPGRTAKVGRNDPCPCGSGRKHKKCCGA
jgi:SEC-C motif domain protein